MVTVRLGSARLAQKLITDVGVAIEDGGREGVGLRCPSLPWDEWTRFSGTKTAGRDSVGLGLGFAGGRLTSVRVTDTKGSDGMKVQGGRGGSGLADVCPRPLRYCVFS